MRAGFDLTGQRFGKLTVKEPTQAREGRYIVWKCICDCGNEILVSTRKLKRRTVTSCGCLRKTTRAKDLTGMRFSRLTVLNKTDKRDIKGSIYWHCRCDCGNEKDITEDSLTNGKTVSCGCKRKEQMIHVHEALTFVDDTCVEWLESKSIRTDNTSGHRGISRRKDGRYVAYIGFRKHRYYLGSFDKIEEAVNAREEAEEAVYGGFVKAYKEYSKYAEKNPKWAKENPFVFDISESKGELLITGINRIPEDGKKIS